MNKHLSKFIIALGVLAAGIICVSRSENASADTLSLQVAPSSFNLDLKPGEVYHGTFSIMNDGDKDVKLATGISPYSAKNNGEGKYEISFDTESEYSMITGWTSLSSDTVTINKDDRIELDFTITIPKDAPGGGQYEYIYVTTNKNNPGEEGVSIAQNFSIGAVIYVTVAGETRHEASILSNDIQGFYFNPPISATSLVENKGNVHATASYILRVFPFFGGESLYNNEENPEKQTLLPGTKRYYTEKWDNAPAIGIYRVESEVHIFDEVSKIEKIIIICPIWVLILIGVFIIAVVFWIVSRVKSRKNAKE